jgi:hypothetical protein
MQDQSVQEAVAEIWELFRETDARFKETDARLDARFKETAASIRKTDEQLRRLEGLFGNQWGKMLEALVRPGALGLFQERGIQVRYTYPRVKVQRNGESREFDLLLEDTDEVVVVEVKSTLRVEDVNDFLDDLDHFLDYFPRYKDYHIYGAVAGLDIIEEADRYAYKRGLFVLSVSGDGLVSILNNEAFLPRDFGHVDA